MMREFVPVPIVDVSSNIKAYASRYFKTGNQTVNSLIILSQQRMEVPFILSTRYLPLLRTRLSWNTDYFLRCEGVSCEKCTIDELQILGTVMNTVEREMVLGFMPSE